MDILVNVDIHRHIEDKSKTLFTLYKKSFSAERRKEIRLNEKSSEDFREANFPSVSAVRSTPALSPSKPVSCKKKGGEAPCIRERALCSF